MPKLRRYRVKLSRATLSTASVTVEASSKQQAAFVAGKMDLEWRDDVADPAVDSVDVMAEG